MKIFVKDLNYKYHISPKIVLILQVIRVKKV